MFFYRHNVEESHLNRYSCTLFNWYLSGKTTKVATGNKNLRIEKVFDKQSQEWVYFVIDQSVDCDIQNRKSSRPHPAVLGFCTMSKRPRWVALETTMLYVSPLSRGKGIASLLYDAILKDGVIVMSGYSHNAKSKKLWLKIVSNPSYVTWAHDIVNLNEYAAIDVVDGNFDCSLKLYEDIKKMRRRRKSDVRIIAINPRYVKA